MCIFVSLLGIPITMLALKSVGELIAKWVSAIVTKFEVKILKRPEPKRLQTKSAAILFSLMVMTIVGNGLLMMFFAGWSLVEGVYFCFVTLTTIGFGDYTTRSSQRITHLTINNSKNQQNHTFEAVDAGDMTASIFGGLFFTFYFILCLCIVSSVLNAIVAAMEQKKCRLRCSGCVPRKAKNNNNINVDTEQNNTPEKHETNTTYLSMRNFGFQKENIASLPVTEIN